MLIPQQVLSLLSIPGSADAWVRIVGWLLFLLGYYYLRAARNENTAFIRWTVPSRMLVLVFFGTITAFNLAAPQFLVFGLMDFCGALWTRWALLR